jgi:hypothetical protein
MIVVLLTWVMIVVLRYGRNAAVSVRRLNCKTIQETCLCKPRGANTTAAPLQIHVGRWCEGVKSPKRNKADWSSQILCWVMFASLRSGKMLCVRAGSVAEVQKHD